MRNRPNRLEDLPPEDRAAFVELAETLEYLPGQTICRQGDQDGYLYLLREGSVSVVREDEHGDKRTIARLAPNTFFGEINFIFGAKRVASLIANEKVVVSRIGAKMKPLLIQKMPVLYNRLRDLGIQRWGATHFLSHPLLKGLAPEDQERLLDEAFMSTHAAGVVLFDQGDPIDDFILLLSGKLRLGARENGEKELNDGDWLLPGGSLHGAPSRWRAVTLLECLIAFVPLEAIRRVADRYPVLKTRLAPGLSA